VRDETVARPYAETLFALAERHEADAKKELIQKVFSPELPPQLVDFLLVTIDKRRQRLLRQMAQHFRELVDEREGRAHVDVTVARQPDGATLDLLTRRLSDLIGATAVPHVRVRPEILGGIIVRAGDTIYDGSVRRRLDGMRRQLLKVELP